MSNIVKKIKAVEKNERAISEWINLDTKYTIDPATVTLNPMRRYDITLTLGASVAVQEADIDHLDAMINNVKRAVIEELYAEFRKPLIELEIAIAEGYQKNALEKVRDIQNNMFDYY